MATIRVDDETVGQLRELYPKTSVHLRRLAKSDAVLVLQALADYIEFRKKQQVENRVQRGRSCRI